jgi:hypothetical protein
MGLSGRLREDEHSLTFNLSKEVRRAPIKHSCHLSAIFASLVTNIPPGGGASSSPIVRNAFLTIVRREHDMLCYACGNKKPPYEELRFSYQTVS